MFMDKMLPFDNQQSKPKLPFNHCHLAIANGIQKSMGFQDDCWNLLKKKLKERGAASKLSALSGVDKAIISRIKSGERGGNFETVAKLLEALGASVTAAINDDSYQHTKDVCFVSPQVVPAGTGLPPPEAEPYLAVPLVGEAGAGPGVVPQNRIESWVLIYRNHHSVAHRRNLLAVTVEKRSESMVPLLYPGDIVLVDRDDIELRKPPGNVYLVREPGQDSGAMIKRVATKKTNGDTLITFYSENVAENPPDVHSLNADYEGDLSRAIVGRVVWSWSDLTKK